MKSDMTPAKEPYYEYDPAQGAEIYAMLHDNPSIKRDTVKRAVAVILKDREDDHYYHPKDGNYRKLQEWEIQGFLLLLRLWDRTEDLKNWARYSSRFGGNNMWRKTCYAELKVALRLHSDYEVKETLRRMEKHGLISRRHAKKRKSDGTASTTLYILVHIYRFKEIVEKARKMLKETYGIKRTKHVKKEQSTKPVKTASSKIKPDNGFSDKITIFETEDNDDKGDKGDSGEGSDNKPGAGTSNSEGVSSSATGGGVLSHCIKTILFSDSGSEDKEERVYRLKEQKGFDTGGIKRATFLIENRTELPAAWKLKSYTQDVVSIAILLQEKFPLEQFTIATLRAIEQRACWLAGKSKQMTPELVKNWLSMCGAYYESGNWRYGDIHDVNFFLQRWVDILTDMRRIVARDRISDAEATLKRATKEWTKTDFYSELDWLERTAKAYPKPVTVADVLDNAFNVGTSSKSVKALSQLVYLQEHGVNIAPVLETRWKKLQKDFFDDPRFFCHLSKDYPLQQWARMNSFQCQQLHSSLDRCRAKATRQLTEKYAIGEHLFVTT